MYFIEAGIHDIPVFQIIATQVDSYRRERAALTHTYTHTHTLSSLTVFYQDVTVEVEFLRFTLGGISFPGSSFLSLAPCVRV